MDSHAWPSRVAAHAAPAHSLDRLQAREKQNDSLKVDGTPRKRTQGFNVDDSKADASSPPKRETYTSGGLPSTRRLSTDAGLPRSSPPSGSPSSFNGMAAVIPPAAAAAPNVPTVAVSPPAAADGKKATTRAERRAQQEAQRAAKAARLASEGKQPPKPKGESSKAPPKSASGDLLAVNGGAGSQGKEAKADKENKAAADKKAGAASKTTTVVPPTLQFDDAKVKRNMEKTGVRRARVRGRTGEGGLTRAAQIIHRTTVQKQVALFSHLPQYEREASFSADIKHSKAGAPPLFFGRCTSSSSSVLFLLTTSRALPRSHSSCRSSAGASLAVARGAYCGC